MELAVRMAARSSVAVRVHRRLVPFLYDLGAYERHGHAISGTDNDLNCALELFDSAHVSKFARPFSGRKKIRTCLVALCVVSRSYGRWSF